MYNEEVNAERCVRALAAALRTTPFRTGLMVIDDGSVDRTPSILKRLQSEVPSLVVVTHEVNQGYGAAVRTGVQQAKLAGYTYVLFMDSDLTNDPKYIPAFVEGMVRGVDVIKASRYIHGGGMISVPRYRVAISIAGNVLARNLMGLPIADCTNGFRAAKVDILSRMPLHEAGFAVIMEELYYAKYLAKTFAEIPCVLTSRGGDTLSKFSYRPAAFWAYLKYALMARLRRRPRLDPDDRSMA